MVTSDIYKIAIDIGIDTDIKKNISKDCPYPDSLILYNKEDRKINKIAVGIDIGAFEIFFAKEFLKCDLVISHHPLSKAGNKMPDIIIQQIENLSSYSVPKEKIENLIKLSSEKLKRDVMDENFYQEEQLARYIDIDLITLHTVADNATTFILRELVEDKNCSTLQDFVSQLSNVSEFKKASSLGQIPFIANGLKESKIGKVSFSEFIGGQESDKGIFIEMKNAGIDTIIAPHLSGDFFESAKNAGLNIVYCGHIASDSLGINYILNKIKEKENDINIYPIGGFLRNKDN